MLRTIPLRRMLPVLGGAMLGTSMVWYHQSQSRLALETQATLKPDMFVPLPLSSSKRVSPDTHELVFDLPKDHKLGGEVTSCVLFKCKDKDGNDVIRPYTPTSDPATLGSATFVIKVYPEGKMSQHLAKLRTNEKVDVKGPIQKYKFEPNKHDQIALIGGGSGITPLYQIMHYIAHNPEDKTKTTLYYGSKTEEDILMRDELDKLVKLKPDQFKVHYFLDKAPDNWKGEKGYITKEALGKTLFKPEDPNTKVFVCGPPALYESISGSKMSPSDQGELSGILKDMGFSKEQVFKF